MNRFFKVFCFIAVVGLLAATPVWGQSNLHWLGTGADPANFTATDNWSPNEAPEGNRWYINVDGTTSPVISGGTINGWDILIGTTEDGSAGTNGILTQTGGDVELQYAMKVGGNGLTGTYNLNDGILHKWNDGGDLEIGVNGGTGYLNIGSTATLTSDHNWTSVGNGIGSTGTVTTSGTVNLGQNILFVGRSGASGTWNQNGGSTTLDDKLVIGGDFNDSTSSAAVLNITGGGLVAARQIGPYSGGTKAGFSSTINIDNGTLKAIYHGTETYRANDWLQSDLKVYIMGGGLTVDTNGGGMPLTFRAPLRDGSTQPGGTANGGLSVINGGSLTLVAASTYTGTTTVGSLSTSATLNLYENSVATSGQLATTGLTINGGSTVNLGYASSLTAALKSATLEGGSTLRLALTESAADPNAINVTNAAGSQVLTVNGGAKLVIDAAGREFDSASYTVFNYGSISLPGGAGSWFESLGSGYRNPSISKTVGVSETTVTVSATAGTDLVWDGPNVTDQRWIAASSVANWLNGVNSDGFYNLDDVRFTNDGLGDGKVNLENYTDLSTGQLVQLHPRDIVVENTTGTYTFQGSGNIVGIGTTLTKDNAGSLTINNSNYFTGDVNVNAGTVSIGSNRALGINNTIYVAAGATLNKPSGEWSVQSQSIDSAGTLDFPGGLSFNAVNNYGASLKMHDSSHLTAGGGWSSAGYGGKADVELRDSAIMDINGTAGIEIGTGSSAGASLKMYDSAKLHVTDYADGAEFRFASSGNAVGVLELSGDSEIDCPHARIADWDTNKQLTITMLDTSRLLADPTRAMPDDQGWMVLGNNDVRLDVTMGVLDGTDTAKIQNGWNWFNMGCYGKITGPGLVMNASTKMILGWEADFGNEAPSDGVLKMELNNDARIEISGRLKMACDAGHVKLTLNDNAAITEKWQTEIANRENSHIELNMNGDSTLDLGFADYGDKQYIACNPDDATGGSAEIVMTGSSKIFNESQSELRFANNGSLDLTMSGTSKIQSVRGSVKIGDASNSSILMEMTGSSKILSNDFVVLGNSAGTTSDITLGELHSATDAPVISANTWLNFACYGATGTLRMNGDSSITANNGSTFGHDAGGEATININDTATIHVNSWIALGDGSGGKATVTMTGGTISSTDWIAISNNTGCEGEVTMSGNSLISTTGELQVGWGGTGKLHIGGSVADTSRVQANTVQLGGSGDAQSLIDLNVGGKLETTKVYTAGAPVSSVLNFNGGILKATANDTTTDPFINNNGTATSFQLNVLAGGAKIDTNGFAISVVTPLTGDAAGRSLEVMNSGGTPGVLTLTGPITNIGPTKVDTGTTLAVQNGSTSTLNTTLASVTGRGSLTVANGAATTTLTVGSIRVGSLAPAAASAVPEPGTLALLAIALAALAGGWWSKRTR